MMAKKKFAAKQAITKLRKAGVLVETRRNRYNQRRPHSALNYRPPAPDTTPPFPTAFTALNPPEMDLRPT